MPKPTITNDSERGFASICQWAEEDRPREKLRDMGADTLTKAELLAILIGSGTTKKSAVELMRDILADCNESLNALGRMTVGELMRYTGIGEAKAITILAACELGRRREVEEALQRPQIKTAEDVYAIMRPVMEDLDIEEFWVVLLNQHLKLIKTLRLSRGGITETAVDVRLILKEALLANATCIAVCHNHPSGNKNPSRQDDQLTKTIQKACETMRIQLIDHVIVTDNGYYSFREQGKI